MAVKVTVAPLVRSVRASLMRFDKFGDIWRDLVSLAGFGEIWRDLTSLVRFGEIL